MKSDINEYILIVFTTIKKYILIAYYYINIIKRLKKNKKNKYYISSYINKQ